MRTKPASTGYGSMKPPKSQKPEDQYSAKMWATGRSNLQYIKKSDHMEQYIGDGKLVQLGKKGIYWYSIYEPGPKDLRIIEQEDREYLRIIARSDPDRFLKEMTPVTDHNGYQLGLDLTLESHQNFQREFAADVCRICLAKGLTTHPALDELPDEVLPTVSTLPWSAAGAGAGVDSKTFPK